MVYNDFINEILKSMRSGNETINDYVWITVTNIGSKRYDTYCSRTKGYVTR